MKAIRVEEDRPGRPLVWAEAEEPAFGPEEVLVEVHAASLNRADLLQRAGNYPPPPGASTVLGLDMAGRIAAVGERASGWQVGDRVCALLPGGGYAERAAVPAAMLMPIPSCWSYAEAAAFPEVFLTAYANLFLEAGLERGETVLMHGGAGGVGTAAIQLAREAGARIIVTAGTDEKVARCAELGANLAIQYKREDFVQRTLEFTRGLGVDVILDIIGAANLAQHLALLRPRGRMVLIAALTGSVAQVDLGMLMGRRLRLIGSVLRSRSLAEKTEIVARFVVRFWPRVEDGTLRPVVDSVFPIELADAAHQRLADNLHTGKIVLQVR